MPKTWPMSFASTLSGLAAVQTRPSQTKPGFLISMMRADGPSGLMKVRSIAVLLGGSRLGDRKSGGEGKGVDPGGGRSREKKKKLISWKLDGNISLL